MLKEQNREIFNRKQNQMISQRIFAFKLLQQENLISNFVNERDFLQEIEKKNSMNLQEKVAFNKKYAQLYNKLQQQYKQCIQNKREKKSAIQKRDNNPKHNQLLKQMY
ncbi:unnamed protein product [Paramecium sonneborni]|uniref:Uncharacterized protein n=1 Tax=Paramecium sonneborni TaxID=65129 RepID=A0A8S1PUA4_9CILI|nr:unnamed protein product [Paramecium sonneborni]